jgi:hypothetical protein
MMRRLSPHGQATEGLAGGRMGVGGLAFFVLAAVAPLTITAGLLGTSLGVLGPVGLALPAAFVAVGIVLGIFAAGYVTMSRHLPHAGAFYAYCAMKRSVIYPAQRGEMGGISLDPMAYSAPKGGMGKIACQETVGHAQTYGVMR